MVSWGVASLLEGKSLGLQLCVKCRQEGYIKSFLLVLKDKKKADSLKLKGPLYSCLLIMCFALRK